MVIKGGLVSSEVETTVASGEVSMLWVKGGVAMQEHVVTLLSVSHGLWIFMRWRLALVGIRSSCWRILPLSKTFGGSGEARWRLPKDGTSFGT